MKSCFVKEEEYYSLQDLENKFELSELETKKIIESLKIKSIIKVKNVKTKKTLDNFEDEPDETDESLEFIFKEGNLFAFTFVGVLYVFNLVIKSYPKYINNFSNLEKDLSQILKVIKRIKYDERFVQNAIQDNNLKDSQNKLPLMLLLLDDYYNHGSYISNHNIYEINGPGSIDWDRTINKTQAIIHRGRPIYPELITRRNTFNDMDYFKRLHEFVITDISRELDEAGVLSLLEYNGLILSGQEVNDFGGTESILYNIVRELDITYNSRNQLILRLMKNYIENKYQSSDKSQFSFYGTTNFKYIWESVCQNVFENKAYIKVSDINALKYESKYKDKLLKNIISKPMWSLYEEDLKPLGILKPDILNIFERNDEVHFTILDAKYYTPKIIEDTIEGQPGVGDVSKQYIYQMGFMDFILEQKIKQLRNIFLFPVNEENNEITKPIGTVRLDFMHDFYYDGEDSENKYKIGLKDIEIMKVSAPNIYKLFLSNEKIVSY